MKGRGLPTRLIMNGVEGIGKSSFAAFAPKPIVAMLKGETGMETLIDSGQIPDTPHFGEIESWQEFLGRIDELIEQDHDHKTFVIDTIGVAERQCHEHVCHREYKDNWGEKGFMAFQRGFDVSLADWVEMLTKLDKLRVERRMAIIMLAHTKVTTFKNPDGPDYDRYECDLHPKTWKLTSRWSDIVLFANYVTVVDESGNRPKGRGGTHRIMYTQREASFDAKNRHGLPETIEMGDSGQEAWANFVSAMKEGKANATQTGGDE